MDLKILFGLLVYWSVIFLVFGGSLSGANVFVDDVSTSGQLNNTFTEDELDLEEAGFFSTIGDIFGMIGRFIGLMLFGLTPVLQDDLQLIFSFIHSIITILGIG